MNIDDSQFRHETIVVMDRSHRTMQNTIPRSGEGAIHIRTARKDHGYCQRGCGLKIRKGQKYVEDRQGCPYDRVPGTRYCLLCAECQDLITEKQRLDIENAAETRNRISNDPVVPVK
jgi:hypothetical protein